jgi:hypothetical protein
MLKHIVLTGESAQHLIDIIALGSREDTKHLFSGVIRLWLDCMSVQIQSEDDSRAGNLGDTLSSRLSEGFAGELPPIGIDQTLYDREKSSLAKRMADVDGPLYNVLKFAAKAAEQRPSVRLGMIDAGSLALVLTAFANADFRLPSLIGAPGPEGRIKGGKSVCRDVSDGTALPNPSSAAVNAEASALSVLIRSAKFTKPWRGQRLDTRLSLCSSLVDSLLGKDDVLDDGYEVTRALFRNIVSADH